MGDQSISATGRYLQLTAEVFPNLIDAMEIAYKDIFPILQPLEEVRMPYEE
jgi:integrase/recombinase XerD